MPHILDISPAALDEQILKDLGFSTPSDFEVIADALNPTEQRILYTRYMEILQDAQRQVRVGVRHTGVMNSDTDWVTDYRIKPPTLKEFIEEPKWLGQTLMPSDDSPGLFPAWRHLILRDFEFGSSIHNLVVTGSLGIGKCWKSGTYMILFNGTLKKVEDIVAGDTLMGDDSTPRTVTSTVKGHGEMYQIYPVQGDPFTVNGDHILVLKSTISEEIVEVTVNDFLAWDTPRRHKACLYREPVDWCEKEVVLDPYWLGLWLGDGHSRQIALTSMDEPLVSYWNNYCKLQGLEIREYSAGKGAKARTYNAVKVGDKGQPQYGKNPLRNKLRELGLCLGDGTTSKFIPQCYLANSRRIRLHLLAGLIDTDGHKCATGNEGTYEITVKQKLFSDQIRFLSQSLGYRAATRIKVVNSTAYFRTTISGAYDIPVLLDRKKSGIKRKRFSNLTGEAFDYGSLKSRFAVIPVGKDDYYGFTLNGNQRCLLGDFTVTHNTFVMVALLLYRLTLATLLKNPQSFFGLSQGSKIVYNILSVTKSQVQETAFGDAINFMSRSDYFVNDCNFDPDSKYSNFRIELPGDIYFTAGSKGWHVLGRNVLGVALDEGNWRNEADPDTTAYDLYNEVRVRIANRFMRTAKFLPAISILASSARDESSFTEQVIKEIAAAKDPEHQIVYRNAVYKIKRAALNLEGSKWFKVCYGLKTMEPYVLQGLYMEDGTPVECGEQHEKAPSGASVEMVPERYLQEFRRRTRVALQSISGISTGGSNRFFSSTIDLMRCIELSVSEGVINPCRQGVTSLAVSMEDNVQVWDYLDHNKFLTIIQSRIQPKRHPEMARFAHLDLATQTVAGLSICHLVGNKLVTGLSDAQGNPFQEYRLIVEYDFILTIIAGRIKPISLEKIQNFIFWLRDKCGFRFLKITADQYQCLNGGTLVNTSRGLLPIEGVKVGDMVQSKSGQNRVVAIHAYENAPTIKITANKGSTVEGTLNHRIEAYPGYKRWLPGGAQAQWVQLKDLKLGDVLSMVRQPVSVDSANAPLLPPPGVSKYSTVRALSDWKYPTHVTPRLAEWVGLMWGDGCMSKGSGVKLSIHELDRECAEKVYKDLFGIVPAWNQSKNKKSGSLALMESSFLKWLEINGLSKPAIKKKNGFTGEIGLPSVILSSSRDVKSAFLRGLFSADGCVTGKEGYISLSTKHGLTAHQVSTLLRTEFGIQTTVVKVWRIGFGKRRLQYVVRVLGSRKSFWDKINFCYARKREKLSRFVGVEGRHLNERVSKIELGHGTVYDLSVENDPSYTANGFISHNSAMPLQMLESRSIPAENLSVDRDNKVYTAWRQASEELRLRMYRQDTMMHEAESLLYVDGNKKVDHPKDGSKDTCLSPLTKVRLLDGRVVQIGQLETGSKFWVYSIDQGGRVKATEAVALGITRKKAAVVRVVLDNEKDVICTPDHLFMLRDGTYRPACDLRPNDSLMPFYFRQAVAQLRQHQVEQVEVLRQEGSSLREACRQTGVSFYIYKTWRKKLNHKVVSVVDSGIEDVTCLSTDIGNFALEAGVFVHNSDSAAGAYFNAIMSEEKLSIAVDNNPSIIGNQSLTDKTFERPPVEIPLPMGYMKIKSFS